MALILEYREKIQKFYRMNAVVILPVLKFLLAFISLNGVNTMMGYMPRLDTLTIVLFASLACSFLPAGCLILLCALFSLGHLYALSLEMLLVGLCAYLLIFLLLLRFAPSNSYVVILTPLFFALKIPYVIPIAVGLLGSPLSSISVACGVIIYYVLKIFVGCAPTISAMDEKEIMDKIRFLLESLLKDKAMLVIAGAFAITVIVVWFIRKMAIEHAWTIAIVAGAMVNLVLLLVGDMIYDVNLSLGSAIFGSILAILVAMVIQFFRFCLDYGRTELVQFEDDDYYYYVKAVPKMSVAAPTKTVKRINSNTQSIPPIPESAGRVTEGRRAGARDGNAAQSRERAREAVQSRSFVEEGDYAVTEEELGQTRAIPQAGNDARVRGQAQVRGGARERGSRQSVASVQGKRAAERPSAGMTSGSASFGTSGRTVTTERVPRSNDASLRRQSSLPARGVTVGSNQMANNADESDDYEELF